MMSTIASGLRHSMQAPSGSMRREQEELDIMKKQLRAEKAEFIKKMAILEQQNEILTLQLAEAQKREKVQQEMSDRVIQVLRDQVSDAQIQASNQAEISIEEDNPKVQQLVAKGIQSMQERLHQQSQDSQHQLYNKEKELQKSQFEVQNLQRELEACKRESETKIRNLEQKMRSTEHEQNSILQELKQQHLERNRELEHAVELLTQEQKKDQEQLINNQRQQTLDQNSKFAKLQRQHQDTLTQLKQALVQIEGLTDQRNQLAKDLESNQQDVVDLENALQEIQIQHQIHEQAARVKQLQMQEEITRLEQVNSLQKSLVKDKSGTRTSTTTLSLNLRERTKSNSSRSKTNIAKPNDDSSYMRFSKEDFEVLPSEIGLEGDDDDSTNKQNRLVSHYRSLSKRLEVQLKDLKDRYKKDVGKLQNMIQTEKQRRNQLFEDKIDRTSQLMKDLVEKDNQIIALQAQLNSVRSYYVEKKYNVPQDEETPPLVSGKKMIQSRQNNKTKLDIPTKAINVPIMKKVDQSPSDNFDTQEGSDAGQVSGYTFITNQNSKFERNSSELIPVGKTKQDFQSIIQTPFKIVVQDDVESAQSSAQRSPRNEYYQLSRNLNHPSEYQDGKKSIDALDNSIVGIALLHNQMSNSSSFEVAKEPFEDSQNEPYSQLQTLTTNVAKPSMKTISPSPLKGPRTADIQQYNQKLPPKKRPAMCSPNNAQKTVPHMLFKTNLKSPSSTLKQAQKKVVLPFRSTSTSRSTSNLKSNKQI